MSSVTQAEYARIKGWSKQYVNRLVQQGKITLVNGKVDIDAADQALAQHADPARATGSDPDAQSATHNQSSQSFSNTGNSGPGNTVDFATARTMREAYKAKLAKLEYEEKVGKLIDAENVKAEAFRTGRIVRDAMLMIPQRVQEMLATITDAHEIGEVLSREITIALDKLSNQMMRGE